MIDYIKRLFVKKEFAEAIAGDLDRIEHRINSRIANKYYTVKSISLVDKSLREEKRGRVHTHHLYVAIVIFKET